MNSLFNPMKYITGFLCLIVVIAAPVSFAQETPAPRKPLSAKNWDKLHDGDMVFIRSRSNNAALIAELSGVDPAEERDTVFTHCGIVFKEDKLWKVLEGAGRGEVLDLAKWQKKEANGGKPHNIYVRRWKTPADLTAETLGKLLTRARELHDTKYDSAFSWTDDRAYCSELNWKAYHAAGLKDLPLHTIGDYLKKLGDNGAAAEAQLNANRKGPDGKGKELDRAESAVSPEDIYGSQLLISIED